MVTTLGEALAAARPRLFNVAKRLARNTWDADDLVQEAMLRAVLRGPAADEIMGWLYVVQRNAFINEARSVHRRRHIPMPAYLLDEIAGSPAVDQDEVVGTVDEVTVAREAIAKLPPKQREAFDLHVFGGMPYEAIAAKLGVPRVTVGTRIWRARETLRAALATRRAAALPAGV